VLAAKNLKSIRISSNPWRNRLITALKFLAGSGIILFLLTSGQLNFADILSSYHNASALIGGVLCCTFAFIIVIVRWWILARIQMLPIGGFEALRLTMIGFFFNTFIPGSTGGDIVRAAYAVQASPDRKAHALTVAFADRGLGLHAMLLLSVAAFFIKPSLFDNAPHLKPWLMLIPAMLIAGIVMPIFLLWERTNGFLVRLCGKIVGGADAWREALRLYRQQPGMVCLAYLCSIGNIVCNVLMLHFMMLAVGSTPELIESFVIVPLVILTNALPITPGGIGIAEAASAGLYAIVGQAGGANAMLLTRLVVILHSLIGFPFFLMGKRHQEVESTPCAR
jgi:uncharacterized protein (TIRG00374 family)